MSYIAHRDYALEAARGNISGVTTVNKFGRAPSGVQTTATDIWDRADAVPTQSIWTAPTAARTHDIVSTSSNDVTGGPGARTVRVYGLETWGTSESNEDISMNGATTVATSNSYVMIHRVKVLTKGATSTNVGTISATAQVDGTVTSIIRPSLGQTQMVVYGVPSTQTLYIGRIYANHLKAGGVGAFVDMAVVQNPEPDAELLNFVTIHNFVVSRDGDSNTTITYAVPKVVAGPAIVKMQGTASSADQDVTAGFDAFVIDN